MTSEATHNTNQVTNALNALKTKPSQLPPSKEQFVTSDGEQISTVARSVLTVDKPITHIPLENEVFLPSGLPNCEYLRNHFFHEGRLNPIHVSRILSSATTLLSQEPNMLTVSAPVTICGDIHGQYYDLMKLFEVGGDPSTTQYLFLGDYVDRGSFSIECLLYLYSLKLTYPDLFWMLRGNHECRHLTEYFTFKEECLHKYNETVYNDSVESFNALPLAAIMNKQFFCVHGGLLPELKVLGDLNAINRFREPPTKGLMCDLLWADPVDDYDEDTMTQSFVRNQVRGCSYAFSYKASCKFLERNGLLLIIRAHEAQDAGYRMYKRTETMGFPSLLTMFSAPNYLDSYNNKAAILKYENNVMNIRQFNASPHPYWLPHFMDAFTWSLPFMGEKITDMLVSILNICTEDELDEATPFEDSALIEPLKTSKPQINIDDASDLPSTYEEKRLALRNKIIAIGRVSRMYLILRQEADSVKTLKNLNSGVLPKGALANGAEGLKSRLLTFEDARKADLANEAMPPSAHDLQEAEKELEQWRRSLTGDTHRSN